MTILQLKPVLAYLCLCLILGGCTSSRNQDVGIHLPGLNISPDTSAAQITPLRLQILQDNATSFGAQAGLSWQARNINKLLTSEERTLNRIFDFNQMLLKDNVLPPVLAEGQNNLNLADDRAIRLADKIYKIQEPPRFVTAAPTWRDYLWMSYPPPDSPPNGLLPKNWRERRVWNQCVKEGWQEGVDQANQIFSANVGRLKHDFAGMVLYRKLLAQNMVTPPYVSRLNLGVTGDANSLRINDQVLRIAAIPQMNINSKTWRPMIIKNEDP
ncbi:MAG: type IV secretion system DotC family protein [Gammaproteobacteria bacterium]